MNRRRAYIPTSLTRWRLIVRAAQDTQLWITTHSEPLAERIERHSGLPRVRPCLIDGETQVEKSPKYS
jgi:predicted ATPase